MFSKVLIIYNYSFGLKDPCSHVRCKYIAKVHELLKKRAIPIHYACNFVLAASDCSSVVRADVSKYNRPFSLMISSFPKLYSFLL